MSRARDGYAAVMLGDLKAARFEEAQAIMALLTAGQEMRRVLDLLLKNPYEPLIRQQGRQALRAHTAASRRYCQASASRAIAREQISISRKSHAHTLAKSR